MSDQFVTVLKSDPQFPDYLDGRVAGNQLAIPVESFAINSPRERVTFRLVQRERYVRPWVGRVFLQLIRWPFLTLTLAPAFVGWAALFRQSAQPSWLETTSLLLSVVLLHIATFSRNDYDDHRHGIDRAQVRRGSQVIQRGWLAAYQVKRISWLALVLAALAGWPLIMHANALVVLLAAAALAAILGFSAAGRGFKNQGAGDLIVGLCMGPLPILAMAGLWAENTAASMFMLGLPLGMAAVIVFQLRQLATMIHERQTRSGTWVSRLGFDRAKKWIQAECAVLPLCVGLVLVPVVPFLESALVMLILFIGQRWLGRRLAMASSPLSSVLVQLPRAGLALHFLTAVILLLCLVWSKWNPA